MKQFPSEPSTSHLLTLTPSDSPVAGVPVGTCPGHSRAVPLSVWTFSLQGQGGGAASYRGPGDPSWSPVPGGPANAAPGRQGPTYLLVVP